MTGISSVKVREGGSIRFLCVWACVCKTLSALTRHEFGPMGGTWMMSGSWDSLREKLCSEKGLECLNCSLHHQRAIPTSSTLRNTGKHTHSRVSITSENITLTSLISWRLSLVTTTTCLTLTSNQVFNLKLDDLCYGTWGFFPLKEGECPQY